MTPDCPECDTRWNVVAAASTAFQDERVRLREELAAARDHGLSFDDLRAASGLSTAVVSQLLREAAL